VYNPEGNYLERGLSTGEFGKVGVDLVGVEVFLGASNVRVALDRSTLPESGINFCLIPRMTCVPAVQWFRQHRRDAQEKYKTDRREHVETLLNPTERMRNVVKHGPFLYENEGHTMIGIGWKSEC